MMTPAQLQCVREKFDVAAALPASERAAFLLRECGDDAVVAQELRELLDRADTATPAPDPQLAGAAGAVAADVFGPPGATLGASNPSTPPSSDETDDLIGAVVGKYRIQAMIGRGGMGVVYRGERESPRMPVAIKIMHPGTVNAKSMSRFELEAQVMANLRHPNIAHVLDAGTDQHRGRTLHFLAIEYVPAAKTITDYCREAGLDTAARLALMVKVCRAMDCAHKGHVIHRDLKPSNILIDGGGEPKVIDFGVARATGLTEGGGGEEAEMLTVRGQLVGTPHYMSPEQTFVEESQVDARSDVYTLGVILYELLAGAMPLGLGTATVAVAIRKIREDTPALLGTLKRDLRGDVEIIVAHALEKEPGRRYPSAAAMADDIDRHVRNEPIEARRASLLYRLLKFARRRWELVGAAGAVALAAGAGLLGTAFVAGALLLALVGFAWQANRIRHQRDESVKAREAESRARKSLESINQFIQTALRSADPNQGGRQDMLVSDAMMKAVGELDGGVFADEPETEATLRLTIAEILHGNGRSEAALKQAEAAQRLLRRVHPGDHTELALSLNRAAVYGQAARRTDQVLPGFQAAREMWERLHKGDHPDVARGLHGEAFCLHALSRPAEALPICRAALEMRKRTIGPNHPDVAESMNNVAANLRSLGKFEEARATYEETLKLRRRLNRGDHPATAGALNNLAMCMFSLGRYADAAAPCEEALRMFERVFTGDHPDISRGMFNLGGCLQTIGQFSEAMRNFESALAMQQRMFPHDHADIARTHNNIGFCMVSLGNAAQARPRLEGALAMQRRLNKGDHADLVATLGNLGLCRQALHLNDDALKELKAACDMADRILPADHPLKAMAHRNIALCYAELGLRGEAVDAANKAAAMASRVLPEGHPHRKKCADTLHAHEERFRSTKAQPDAHRA